MCFHKSLLIGAHGAPPALVAAPPRCGLCDLLFDLNSPPRMKNGPQWTTKTSGVAKPADWLLWSFERRCLQRPAVLSVLLSPVFRLLYPLQLSLASVLLFVLGIPTRSISNQFSRGFDL